MTALKRGLVSKPLAFGAPDEDGNFAVPPFTWFEAVGNHTGAGIVLREGPELDAAQPGEADVGLSCRVELMRAVDAPDEDGRKKKMRSKIVEPVVGWVTSSFLRCISDGCGYCDHCHQTKTKQEGDELTEANSAPAASAVAAAEGEQTSGAAASAFDAMDRNHDGVIDREEYHQGQEAQRQAEALAAEKLKRMTSRSNLPRPRQCGCRKSGLLILSMRSGNFAFETRRGA